MPRLFKICSVVAHTIVVTWVVVAELLAVGPLPVPRAPITFAGMIPITVIDVPPPPPRTQNTAPQNTVSPDAAPLEAPTAITPETPHEPVASRGAGFVDGGVPNGVDLGTMPHVSLPPPPPPPPPQTPMRLSGMRPPQKVANVDPVYPYNAKIARVDGVVILETTIDTRGRVTDVRVLRSVALLDQAAVDAVRQWVYTPTLLNGVPVPIIMTVTVRFKLQD